MWVLRWWREIPVSRIVCFKDLQGPETYTNLPIWESAPEGPNLLMGSGGMTESQPKAEQSLLFPLGSFPRIW